MKLSSFGVEPNLLAQHASLLAVSELRCWTQVAEAWKGIKNYPLPPPKQAYLRNRLLATANPSCLWQIHSPLLVIYRWPNGEFRYFVITDSGHLVESQWGSRFFNAFPFISGNVENGFSFDLDFSNLIELDESYLWMPHLENYSHFLCDAFGPWIDFFASSLLPVIPNFVVPTFKPWLQWQKELLKHLPFSYRRLPPLAPGQCMILRPKSLLMPIATCLVAIQQSLRIWFDSLFYHSEESEKSLPRQLIFMARLNHHSSRIRNQSEITQLIESLGGLTVDPSSLTFLEKYFYFSRARVVIGDGSASMNMILLAPEYCRFIALVDPIALLNDSFLDGGFPYSDLIASRTHPVCGKKPQLLKGSPLASCHYDLQDIRDMILGLI
jgi:hypothetical protein